MCMLCLVMYAVLRNIYKQMTGQNRGISRISGKGVLMYKCVGFAWLIFSFLLNIPFGLAETQLFHFHRISKNEGQGEGFNWIP